MASDAGETATSYRSRLGAAAAGFLRRTGRRAKAPPARGGVSAAPDQDAYLAMRDEWMAGKLRERAQEDKVKQLSAQLARTEEAAKRILTRADPAARGGAAQRLLDLERENTGLRAERAELQSQLDKVMQTETEARRQAADLKAKLEAALKRVRARAPAAAAAAAWSPARSPGRSPVRGGRFVGSGEAGTSALVAEDADVGVAVSTAALAAAEVAREVAALQAQLAQQQGLAQRQATEIRALQALLAQQEEETRRRRLTAGSGGGGAWEGELEEGAGPAVSAAGPVRLKYLKTKSALDSATSANTRLLRELEEARAQVGLLLEQQAAAERREQARRREDARAAVAAAARRPQPGPAPPAGACGKENAARAGGGAAPGEVLQLQQQLAAARHRVARLEIELEAAIAKLAILQASVHQQQRLEPDESEGRHAPCGVSPLRVERTASVQRLAPHPRPRQPLAPEAPLERQQQPEAREQQGHRRAALPGLAPDQNVVQLRLQGAELRAATGDSPGLGPQSLTFLSADFYCHETQVTSLGEGQAPDYDTTLQFVVMDDAALRAHLASESVRVELHTAVPAAAAAGMLPDAPAQLEYVTVASGSIPLRGLLAHAEGEGGSSGGGCPRECWLTARGGEAVARVCYELSFYDVPEGHINSDLSSTACNIGLTRRKDLSMRQDLKLTIEGEDHSLADLLRGQRTLLFGVPDRGAVCSEQQLPGYLREWEALREAGVTRLLCLTVGSAADAESWTERLGIDGDSRLQARGCAAALHVAADTSQGLTRFFGMELAPLGQPPPHSQRWAALVDDGILVKIRVEASPGELKVTSAEAMKELAKKCLG
eukprot:scaffold5.g724.t1